jgi:hypothetical protein
MQKPIYVTQPYLPPLEEFILYLQQIWDKKILINGTIALVTALQLDADPTAVLPNTSNRGSKV